MVLVRQAMKGLFISVYIYYLLADIADRYFPFYTLTQGY